MQCSNDLKSTFNETGVSLLKFYKRCKLCRSRKNDSDVWQLFNIYQKLFAKLKYAKKSTE